MEEHFQIGVITAPHGVRGEVKVFPTTDDVNRFKKLKKIIVAQNSSDHLSQLRTNQPELLVTLTIENVKFFKQFVILKFAGIDDMDNAQKYKGKSLWVERQDAVKLERDEYFVADLMGMLVVDETEAPLGRLTDVIRTGANDVYAVAMDDGKEVLIPAIKDCILNVDIDGFKMKVRLMDGLF